MEVWKHLQAIILLPGVVTLVIPGTILWRTGMDSFGLWQSVPASRVILPIIGITCICLGLVLMTSTIRLFATYGEGTLAPWEPPQRLVVRGVYRHVRNPMISGVLFVLLGESVLTASVPLFQWFLIFAVINTLYIPLLEEPMLVDRFGYDYRVYKQNVPRWIPRWKSWQDLSRDIVRRPVQEDRARQVAQFQRQCGSGR
jgi:protein-S-isoprenylcysteine O-methyltransferase Ste14